MVEVNGELVRACAILDSIGKRIKSRSAAAADE
jgi:hypothetical protein